MDHMSELVGFLAPDTRADVQGTALEYFLGLTASDSGRALVMQQGDTVLPQLCELTLHKVECISRDAFLALLNLSAFQDAAKSLIKLNVIPKFLEIITQPSNSNADPACMILSNLTRDPDGAHLLTQLLCSEEKPTIEQLVDIFNSSDYNPHAKLHHLATVFSNITQIPAARQLFLDQAKNFIPRLLPFLQYKDSLTRRGGIAGLMRNLCFEVGQLTG